MTKTIKSTDLKNHDVAIELAEGISEMIAAGRLTESDIPEDFYWLTNKLAQIGESTNGI